MKVLVIGSGGREHALTWKIAQSNRVEKIYAIPGNAGMKDLAEIIDIKVANTIEIADFAQEEKIDLTVVGPEMILSLGIVDEFNKRNLKIFGPSQKAAVLESSKAFCKEFFKKHKIPTADFRTFVSTSDALNFIKNTEYPLVIKADGLAEGKGVFICQNDSMAEDCINQLMVDNKLGQSGEKIVIEDFLKGQEMSFMVISDGKRVIPLATSMDYKKIYDGDKGPNTGGMGAISPAPQINSKLFDKIMKTIINPTIEGMRDEGREFKGLLYAGLMIDNDEPKILEYNVRFGDPETQPLLMRLKTDLVDLLEGSAEGNLLDIAVEWEEQVSGCVVLASKGYPLKYDKDKKINGLDRARSLGIEIFHAGTTFRDNTFYTNGGRVLNICAAGKTLEETMKKIYNAISFISFDNIYFRHDIGIVKGE
jgi:phosphoribosylamine--glycine ligase